MSDERVTGDDGWVPVPGAGEPDAIRELNDVDLLTELTHPVRSRILRALKQPRAVAEVATLLDVPVTRLYHHVNRLESLDFVRVVATRQVAAVTERRYQVAADSWQADKGLFEASDLAEMALALGSLFEISKLSFQREVEHGSLAAGPIEGETMLTRSMKVLSTERRKELVAAMTALIEEFESDVDEDDPDAHRMEIFAAIFPDTT